MKPPKVSVRFQMTTAAGDEMGNVKIKGIASYNRKRLFFQWQAKCWEIPYLHNVLDSKGNLLPNYQELCNRFGYEAEAVEEFSRHLILMRDAVMKIIDRALSYGVWDKMTTADLRVMVERLEIGKTTNVDDFFVKGGLFHLLLTDIK